MSKQEYLQLKKELRNKCKTNVKEICHNAGLDDYEKALIDELYTKTKKINTCVRLGIGETKYTNDLKQALNKINDYLKRH